MKPANSHASFYHHPHSRWFDSEPRDRDELRKTHLAFEHELGPDHPMTFIAGSWVGVGECYSFESEPLGLLMGAEPFLRQDVVRNRYALACNLAAQGLLLQTYDDPSRARGLFQEALQHARLCGEMHRMDVLKIVELLALDLNWGGLRQQAIDLLRSYEDEIAKEFSEYPNECYELLGLWVEFVGDAQIESEEASGLAHRAIASSNCDAAVSKAVVALARAARKAHFNGDAAGARCHFRCAAATLMASPTIHRARGGALASMLATQAAGQHRSQKFRVVYG